MTVAVPRAPRKRRKPAHRKTAPVVPIPLFRPSGFLLSGTALTIGLLAVFAAVQIHARYALSLQSPIRLHFQWPLVIALRTKTEDAYAAQFDQRHPLTAYQQYACAKFGPACRLALAIQRAENPQGKCEIYHYNTDGTLDWGYFQINTVHLKRPGLNLRDLLDCKTNIDFAYQLYVEKHGFTPWSTYNKGMYKRFLR
jgi:hypothetical protein